MSDTPTLTDSLPRGRYAFLTETETIAHLDFCGATSCDTYLDPEFPPCVCTLPKGHEGMHHQEGVACSWSRPEEVAERGW